MSELSLRVKQKEVRVSRIGNGEDILGRGNNLGKQLGVWGSTLCLWDVIQYIKVEIEINQRWEREDINLEKLS